MIWVFLVQFLVKKKGWRAEMLCGLYRAFNKIMILSKFPKGGLLNILFLNDPSWESNTDISIPLIKPRCTSIQFYWNIFNIRPAVLEFQLQRLFLVLQTQCKCYFHAYNLSSRSTNQIPFWLQSWRRWTDRKRNNN